MELIKQYSSDEEEEDPTSEEQQSPIHDYITTLPIYSMFAPHLGQFRLYTFIPWKPSQTVQKKINDICAQARRECNIPDINWLPANMLNPNISFHMTLQSNIYGKGYQIKQLKDNFKSYLRTNESITEKDIFTSKTDIARQLKLAKFLDQPPKPPKKFLKFSFKPQLYILPSVTTERVFLTASFQNTDIFKQLALTLHKSATDLQFNSVESVPQDFHVSFQRGDFMTSAEADEFNQRLSQFNTGLENIDFFCNEVTFMAERSRSPEIVSLIPDRLQELEMENNYDE